MYCLWFSVILTIIDQLSSTRLLTRSFMTLRQFNLLVCESLSTSMQSNRSWSESLSQKRHFHSSRASELKSSILSLSLKCKSNITMIESINLSTWSLRIMSIFDYIMNTIFLLSRCLNQSLVNNTLNFSKFWKRLINCLIDLICLRTDAYILFYQWHNWSRRLLTKIFIVDHDLLIRISSLLKKTLSW